MGVTLLITIRTADRTPKRNYLGETVRAFLRRGVCDPSLIHLFPTSPDIAWMADQLGELPVSIHAPSRTRTPNENGIAQVSALDVVDAEWIGLFEDDLEFCADPLGSMTRWLADQARPDISLYRFFALPRTPVARQAANVSWCPLREMRGSQAVAMRAADARAFAAWASAHPRNWRPKQAPFQDRATKGFDKLLGYWALQHNPKQPYGLVSRPYFVRHVGVESALYSHGLRNDREFAGTTWQYGSAA